MIIHLCRCFLRVIAVIVGYSSNLFQHIAWQRYSIATTSSILFWNWLYVTLSRQVTTYWINFVVCVTLGGLTIWAAVDAHVHIRKQADLYPFYVPMRNATINFFVSIQLKRWLCCSRHEQLYMQLSDIRVHGLKNISRSKKQKKTKTLCWLQNEFGEAASRTLS